MAYKMRFRVQIRLITPQNVEADAKNADAVLLDVGDVTTPQDPDGGYTNPTGPIITSMTQAISAVVGVTRRLQAGLKTNVRFEVFGKPVGAPEDGATDLTAEAKTEQLYIAGDTPNAGLLYQIARANRKPVTTNSGMFVPPDVKPEPLIPQA